MKCYVKDSFGNQFCRVVTREESKVDVTINKAWVGGGVTVKLTHERLWPHGCDVRVFADSCACLQMAGS